MNIPVEDKFSLDPKYYRTSEERSAMVLDPACPLSVIKVVVEYDDDDTVILDCIHSKIADEEVFAIAARRLNKTVKELKDGRREYYKKLIARKSFCSIPWNHAGTDASGNIRMCCQMIHENEKAPKGIVKKDDGSTLDFNDHISENRNAPAWKELRKDMLVGKKNDLCKLCWDEEDSGTGSRRIYTFDLFPDTIDKAIEKTESDGSIKHEDFPIQWWDLRFGNKCNLKCRSCGPTDSNLWYEDHIALTRSEDDPEVIMRDGEAHKIEKDAKGKWHVPILSEWFNDSTMWNDLVDNLDTVDRIYFTGGEPTINHKHQELLKIIIDKGYANKMVLDYNTNMAGTPDKLFDLWTQFKKVNLGLSIDGMYEHYEYIRHPGRWDKVERNLRKIDTDPRLTNLSANITLTLSVMNVFHVLDLIWWLKEQKFRRIHNDIYIHNVYGPQYYNVQNLPGGIKHDVDAHYKRFIDAISKRWGNDKCTTHDANWAAETTRSLEATLSQMWSAEPDPSHWKHFLTLTSELDKLRKENWKKSLPELESAMRNMHDKEKRRKRTRLAAIKKAPKTTGTTGAPKKS